MNKLFDHLKAPKIFEPGPNEIWTDPLMSKLVHEEHLDPNTPGGSANDLFINKSVAFIQDIAPSSTFKKIIDLGCGPGFYCQKLAEKGYEVTGIDFSQNSIRFAEEKARIENLDIEYRVDNFFNWNETNKYDVALLIYYTFSSLSPDERNKLLQKVHNSLKKGGLLIIDGFSENVFNKFKEEQTWSFSKKESILSKDSHLGFMQNLIYPNKVTLTKTTILIEDENPRTYHYWYQYFSKDTLEKETSNVGFKTKGIYSDISSLEFDEESDSIAFVLEK
ncbi:class I SAM-dependent methyltransferase [Viridibacillus sp. NPDC096237]|uniref:class I SAM-dependent methyltransferase n=1 Tax=Viridibacillus sp. NPDC096237 TaxID=3390721 RepID=UPI003D005C29